ncbi:hypothetical protein GH714_014593 [Hevea brasiliensis]|uniref:Cytochrome P450 n=1 Tax=Hevea brasiliensis TaxID=3981 RepID=A0A6A6KRC7_HEVBR|nr:hypothetical protein GH714_032006 [Hevea brasiliensis]KAF2289999.1 hypothetical protein GH714_039641 [Hevea brasiliensis]KAF2324469.1 hypothetical protein GH714_014593 [Hevea brasiliensis]
MDYLLHFPDALAAVFALLLLLYYLSRNRRKKKAAPEAEGAWPLIGHLHLLGGPQPPHMVLSNVADKIGPIFTIRMGMHITLIVSNWETAKECLTTNDKVFATRPKTIFTEIMGYNRSMFGFIPYGPYWRQVRKIATHELLSNHRLEMLKNVREIRGRFVPADAVPFLRWLDIGGFEKAMMKTAKELDHVVEVWLNEHKEKRASGFNQEEEDFMDLMLNILDETEIVEGPDSDTMNKATCLVISVSVLSTYHFLRPLLAASDTTTVTLTWALSLLVNNPEARKKAQSELDVHVGRERQVQESDMKNLIYHQAILKETMRLYPAGPLSLPHESTEHCTVGGYKYRQARDFSSIFGKFIMIRNGRRMCPGISFALQVMQLTLAKLLHGFDIENPSDEPIDMTESMD